MIERQVWINGDFVPESQAVISIRALGLDYGDGVFDSARSFGGRLFRAKAHVTRLYESLAPCRIPAPSPVVQILALTAELVARPQGGRGRRGLPHARRCRCGCGVFGMAFCTDRCTAHDRASGAGITGQAEHLSERVICWAGGGGLASGAGALMRHAEETVTDARAMGADEVFLTSTSLCVCQLCSLDART